MSSRGKTRRAGYFAEQQRDGQRKPDSNRPHTHFNGLSGLSKALLRWLHVGRG